jgi:hypothetical protein
MLHFVLGERSRWRQQYKGSEDQEGERRDGPG